MPPSLTLAPSQCGHPEGTGCHGPLLSAHYVSNSGMGAAEADTDFDIVSARLSNACQRTSNLTDRLPTPLRRRRLSRSPLSYAPPMNVRPACALEFPRGRTPGSTGSFGGGTGKRFRGREAQAEAVAAATA